MNTQKIQSLRVFLKDGFPVTSIYGQDATIVLDAIGENRKPTNLMARGVTGQPIEGEYFELTLSMSVSLGSETKYLHEGQIYLIVYDDTPPRSSMNTVH